MWIQYVFIWRMLAQVRYEKKMEDRWRQNFSGDRISVEKCLKWNLGSETRLSINVVKLIKGSYYLVKSKHCFCDNPLRLG